MILDFWLSTLRQYSQILTIDAALEFRIGEAIFYSFGKTADLKAYLQTVTL